MSRARSPSYPSVSLKEAVERVTMIYNEDYQNPIPRRVAAEHMGYQSLNGKSLGVLSALLKFGLLEGRGDDTRVSDSALQIIAHPPGSRERARALQEAAGLPELFAEINSRFNDGKASDQAIRSYLLTQRFIPAGADAAIRAYRETKQFVAVESSGLGGEHAPTEPVEAHELKTLPQLVGQSEVFGATKGMRSSELPAGSGETKLMIGDDIVTVSATLLTQKELQKLVDKLIAIKSLLPDDKLD